MKNLLNVTSLDQVPLPEKLPPIVIMAFTRYEFLEKLIEAIHNQTLAPSLILAFVDGPRNEKDKILIEKTISLLENIKKIPTKIVARPHNLGCDKNVLTSLTEVFAEHDTLIYLEEDVIPTNFFYERMCRLLERYREEKKVFSVSAYATNFPQEAEDSITTDFLASNRVFALGWGTWRDRWQDIDLINKPDGYNPYSYFYKIPATVQTKRTIINQFFLERNNKTDWVITMTLVSLSEGYVHIIPRFSFVKNIGFDHPDSKTTKNAEPEWLNARWNPTLYPDTLSSEIEVIPSLSNPISGTIIAETLESYQGVQLSLIALIYLLVKCTEMTSRTAFLHLICRNLREKVTTKISKKACFLQKRFSS